MYFSDARVCFRKIPSCYCRFFFARTSEITNTPSPLLKKKQWHSRATRILGIKAKTQRRLFYSKYIGVLYMQPNFNDLRVLSHFRSLDVMQNSKMWLKLWEYRKYFAFICQQNELTYGIPEYRKYKTCQYQNSMIAAFVIYFGETKKSLRGRDFFSFEISLYFSKYFSLHLFIFILLRSPLITFKLKLDCEQSLFFFRFNKSNARARERRSGETRETRAASPVSRHQSRAWPFACLAFARRTTEKRETARSLSLSRFVFVTSVSQQHYSGVFYTG